MLLQTFLPQHDVVQAAFLADPGRIVERERRQRSMLGLPPFGALAEISGQGSDEFVTSIPPADGVVVVGAAAGAYGSRARDWMTLGEAINAGVRPPHSGLRIAVDPPR